MDVRTERIGRNEDLFRKVNDQIEGVNEAFGTITGTMSILCECGNSSCTEQITVTLPEYERIRSDSELFFVCSGHEQADVEEVREQHGDYDVVRKKAGEAAELAHELDPRDQ